MAFVDELKIYARAGAGGDGVVRWRREKFIPKGGPAGGNGGRGGDVYLKGVSDIYKLSEYSHMDKFLAENGGAGGDGEKEGANGDDLVIYVPVGSVVTNLDTNDVYEILKIDETKLILKAGRGGFGNAHFKSSKNTTPKESTSGKDGEDAKFFIELKLFAEIGLIGLPSAGKSTIINSLTNTKAKVAAYPFTTLEPNLGDFYGHIIADIPGLIENASKGKGLGMKFLRHVSRTKALAHVISLENEDLAKAYSTIWNELNAYDKSLSKKDELVVLSKTDLSDEKTIQKWIKYFEKKKKKVITFSAYDNKSIKALSKEMRNLIK